MASYALKGSYPTVQTLSPTVQEAVQYCTVQTFPSSVFASIPVSEASFSANEAAVQLTNFADAIEQIMQNTAVISAVGSQTVDPSGLLLDNVVFTVGYPAPASPSTQLTAEAVVPVGYLDFSDAEIGRVSLANVDAILNAAYASLKSAAGG